MKVINQTVTDAEMAVSMKLSVAVFKAAETVCKAESVGLNIGVGALATALFNLAAKAGVRTETLVEVIRELAIDESKTVKA